MPTDTRTPRRIAVLTTADAAAYRTLRLDALRRHPEAFGADLSEEVRMRPEDFAARMPLAPSAALGALVPVGQGTERLVGIASLIVPSRVKLAHKADLFGVYVDPQHRGSGIARDLVAHAIALARNAGLRVLHLSVTAGNDNATRLYTSLGFRPYGVEPRSLGVAGRLYDMTLMALLLD